MDQNNESTFRIIFGAFWVINILIRIYFQKRAFNPDREFVRHGQRERIHFYTFMIAYLILSLYFASSSVDFAHISFSDYLRWLGVFVLTCYSLLFGWAHYALGRNWSGGLEIHRDHVLITGGPYKFVRHPMYSAFYLSAIGIFLLSANWLVSGLYFLALTWMYVGRVRSEEEMMIERFGSKYQEYMQTTGRLFPRLRDTFIRM